MTPSNALPLTFEDLLQHIRHNGEWLNVRSFLMHAGLPVDGEDTFIAAKNGSARIGGLNPVSIAVFERLDQDPRVSVTVGTGALNKGVVSFKVDHDQVPLKPLQQGDARATYHWVG